MKAQLDLFRASSAAPIDPHIGVPIELPDACKCGCTFAQIGAGIGPHRASLRCASCGVHRGWLARENSRLHQRDHPQIWPPYRTDHHPTR